MRSTSRFSFVITLMITVCLTGLLAAAGQQTGFDYLMPLKNALSSAGATALTSAQESSIRTLVANLRSSNTPPSPGSTATAARQAYEAAIITGQQAAAEAQIPAIVDEMLSSTTARLKKNAAFVINVLQVLDTTQVSALVQQFGAGGVVRMVEMLAGGPGPGGGPGRGPMGMGRPVGE
jgi:hypothetical protein